MMLIRIKYLAQIAQLVRFSRFFKLLAFLIGVGGLVASFAQPTHAMWRKKKTPEIPLSLEQTYEMNVRELHASLETRIRTYRCYTNATYIRWFHLTPKIEAEFVIERLDSYPAGLYRSSQFAAKRLEIARNVGYIGRCSGLLRFLDLGADFGDYSELKVAILEAYVADLPYSHAPLGDYSLTTSQECIDLWKKVYAKNKKLALEIAREQWRPWLSAGPVGFLKELLNLDPPVLVTARNSSDIDSIPFLEALGHSRTWSIEAILEAIEVNPDVSSIALFGTSFSFLEKQLLVPVGLLEKYLGVIRTKNWQREFLTSTKWQNDRGEGNLLTRLLQTRTPASDTPQFKTLFHWILNSDADAEIPLAYFNERVGSDTPLQMIGKSGLDLRYLVDLLKRGVELDAFFQGDLSWTQADALTRERRAFFYDLQRLWDWQSRGIFLSVQIFIREKTDYISGLKLSSDSDDAKLLEIAKIIESRMDTSSRGESGGSSDVPPKPEDGASSLARFSYLALAGVGAGAESPALPSAPPPEQPALAPSFETRADATRELIRLIRESTEANQFNIPFIKRILLHPMTDPSLMDDEGIMGPLDWAETRGHAPLQFLISKCVLLQGASDLRRLEALLRQFTTDSTRRSTLSDIGVDPLGALLNWVTQQYGKKVREQLEASDDADDARTSFSSASRVTSRTSGTARTRDPGSQTGGARHSARGQRGPRQIMVIKPPSQGGGS